MASSSESSSSMFRGSPFDDNPYDLEYLYATTMLQVSQILPRYQQMSPSSWTGRTMQRIFLPYEPPKEYGPPEEYKLSTLAEGKSFPLIHPVYLTSMESAYRKQIYGRRYLYGPSPSGSWSSPNKRNFELCLHRPSGNEWNFSWTRFIITID